MRAAHRTADGDLVPLVFAFLGPPVIWAVRFSVSYALVPWACLGGSELWLQVITLAALAGTGWAGVVAWRAWRAAPPGEELGLGSARIRTRFIGAVGMLQSILFFLVIVAEALAIFLVSPCQTGGVPL